VRQKLIKGERASAVVAGAVRERTAQRFGSNRNRSVWSSVRNRAESKTRKLVNGYLVTVVEREGDETRKVMNLREPVEGETGEPMVGEEGIWSRSRDRTESESGKLFIGEAAATLLAGAVTQTRNRVR
jgi:hypothetical protein